MIPIRDNIPSRTTPFVNYTMIAICSVVFLAQLAERPGEGALVERYGMIPARVVDPDRPVQIVDARPVRTPLGTRLVESRREAAPAGVPAILTLLTCVFLHGGWMHFLGNMWFLHIFGDNVEDRFGHGRYILFYLACGVAASLAQLATAPESTIPTIGASGAIAGVMGAYFLLYPGAKVLTMVPIFYFLQMMVVPAPLFLGVWFLIQFFQGAFAITSTASAGVAWWAHIGGFVAGFVAAAWLRRRDKLKPRVEMVRPGTERVGSYRVQFRNDPRL